MTAESERPRDLDPIEPYADFRGAAEAVLKLLHQNHGMGLWLVTRTEGEDWIVLSAEDHGYGVASGDVFRWSDSFCSRMVRGLGPRIAPVADEVPEYATAPIGQQVDIGAYIGLPLRRADGSFFGTLCAIDPEPKPRSLEGELPALETYGRLLATILDSELNRQEQAREIERTEVESETDALTGIYNRRGWERLRDAEENRCSRYGNPAAVVMVDLDGLKKINDEHGHAAGDRTLKRAAEALRKSVRSTDVVARLGGDEFGVLAIEESVEGLERLVTRLRRALDRAGVEASVGGACRDPRNHLEEAQKRADEEMYVQKKSRGRGRAAVR